jgi:hypothetical protein
MIPAHCLSLTIEQQFKLRMLDADIDRLSPEDARAMVRDLMRQLEIKDNVLKHLIMRELF